MKRMQTIVIMVLMTIAMTVIGCGGGGARVQQQTTTLGQELQDLDVAYKKGLLSEKEYNKAREDLIDRYTD